MAYYKDRKPEEIIQDMKNILKDKNVNDNYIRNLVAMQKGELDVNSSFYEGKIAEGNWSVLDDYDIKEISDTKTSPDAFDLIFKVESSPDEIYDKSKIELDYVFRPSLYAVFTLILYYIEDYEKDDKDAKKVYNLKNSVVRRESDKFYGGLPFVLRYIDWILEYKSKYLDEKEDEKITDDLMNIKIKTFDNSKFNEILKEFKDLLRDLFEVCDGLNENCIEDDFISDIVDCINASSAEDFFVEMRIDDIEKDEDMLMEYAIINDYTILLHSAIEKVDFKHLREDQINLIKKHIEKTPNHPYNDKPTDSKRMHGKLKEWFEQKVSSKKEKMVYKKDEENKKVYIATVSDHYKYAEGRTKSTVAYK